MDRVSEVRRGVTAGLGLSGIAVAIGGLAWGLWSERQAHVRFDQFASDSSWLVTARSFVLPHGLARFATATHASKNGPKERRLFDCPFGGLVGVSDPFWQRLEKNWREAAQCDEIKHVVRKVESGDLEAPWIRIGNTRQLAPWVLYRSIHSHAAAVLARAHKEMMEGAFEASDRDARAVVRIGMLLHDAPDFEGLEIGNAAITAGLDHLAAISRQRGQMNAASEILAMKSRIPPNETCRGPLKLGVYRAAIIPRDFRTLLAASRDTTIPLAVRNHIRQSVATAYLRHPAEVLTGQAERRRAAEAQLDAEPTLAQAQVPAPPKRLFSRLVAVAAQ